MTNTNEKYGRTQQGNLLILYKPRAVLLLMSRLVSHKGLEVGINYIFFVFTKDSDCEDYNMTFIKSIVSSFALLD